MVPSLNLTQPSVAAAVGCEAGVDVASAAVWVTVGRAVSVAVFDLGAAVVVAAAAVDVAALVAVETVVDVAVAALVCVAVAIEVVVVVLAAVAVRAVVAVAAAVGAAVAVRAAVAVATAVGAAVGPAWARASSGHTPGRIAIPIIRPRVDASRQALFQSRFFPIRPSQHWAEDTPVASSTSWRDYLPIVNSQMVALTGDIGPELPPSSDHGSMEACGMHNVLQIAPRVWHVARG
jgi:hypothetical protein